MAIGFAGGSTTFPYVFNINIYPFATWTIVVYVVLVAYAITKTHLMDISVIISRAAAWILTVTFLGVIYVGLVMAYRTYISHQIGFLFIVGSILYGIFVGEVFQRIRLFLQTTSDKVFLRGRYDYYQELSNASSRVGQKLSLPDILKVLYDTFHDVVEIANPRVYLPENFTEGGDKTSARYLPYSKEDYKPVLAAKEIKFDSPLVKTLSAKREPQADGKELDARLIVPCLVEDRLVGLFVLGRKLSEDPYTDEDLRLLKVLSNQAAITLDHTRSYQKIKSDLETAEKQLERSQRLASLGTLTAGVTHEIRNPLTVIRAETERLANEARDVDYLKQFSSLVIKHIDRIGGIVQRMLGLAKEKTVEMKELNLNELIEGTLHCFNFEKVTVKREYSPIPPIKGDNEGLEEVFVNLIQNSLEAMPEGGLLTLKTMVEEGRVAVEISDTGKGIPDELREKIFDPFFSTRHEGTGLGLSIVYRIVRQHGGDIKVSSEVGKGTTFKILF